MVFITALYIIGGILLFFVLIFSLKATVTVAYRDEVALTVRVLFFKIRILPKKEPKRGPFSMSAKKAKKIREKLRKKQLKKAEAKRQKAEKKKQKKAEAKLHPKKKKSLSEILDMIDLVKKLCAAVIKRFARHLRLDLARLRICVATGDAATTAIAYGAITQAINVFFPLLEKVKNFDLPKTKDIDVYADFTKESIEADVEISFSLRVWHVFDVAFGALFAFIKHTVKRMLSHPPAHKKPTKAAESNQKSA